MQTVSNVLARKARKMIEERIEDIKNDMALGAAIVSLEAYRGAVGEIKGLREALDILDAAERDLAKQP